MRNVLLDTSVYRSDPQRSKAAFQALELSCRAGVIRLHVPFVVQHEYLSFVHSHISDKLEAATRALRGLNRHASRPDLGEKARRLEVAVERLGKDLLEEARRTFIGWLELHRAVIHPVGDSHGQRVLVRYFSGGPPFRAAKSREDLPDAFIAALIEDLAAQYSAAQYEDMHVVSGDARLRTAASKCPGVHVHEKLEDLMAALDSDDQGGFTDPNIQTASRVLAEFDLDLWTYPAHSLSEFVTDERVVMSLAGREIESRVSHVDTVFNVAVDGDRLSHLGGGVCVVPFEARVHSGIVYSVDKDFYDDLPEEVTEDLTVVLEDGRQYAVAEERAAIIDGLLRLELNLERLESDRLSYGEVLDMLHESPVTLDSAEVRAMDPRPKRPDESDGA